VDRHVAWCEIFDDSPFGTVLRDMRTRTANEKAQDVDWYTHFKLGTFAKGDAPVEDAARPDPERAAAIDALLMGD
jgi:hypothetical protein